MPSLVSRITVVVVAALFVVGGASALPPNGPSPSIVISQVYGGGGSTSAASGAVYTTDYIELFNRGSSPQSVAGWSVQYASATGTGNFTATALPAVTIPAGGYLLVGEGTVAGAVGAPLPPTDASGAIAMSATAGKVALIQQATSLACNGSSTPCSPAQTALILDLVGYGTANFSETSPAPTLAASTAALRADHGCTDTDSNAADFTAGLPAPRNAATTAEPCGAPPAETAPSVTSTTPSDGATGVAANAAISVVFSEPVNADVDAFSITCPSGFRSPAASPSADHRTYTLTTTPFAPGEVCTTTLTATMIHDVDVSDPPDTMAADYVFSFTIAAPVAIVPIHDIQGAAHLSPLANQTVGTTGVVTAVKGNGFYVQDPSPDANPATSEAIFVFTSSAPTVFVGNGVQVSGRVSEFRPGATGLTNTELVAPLTITTLSSGNPLPAPILIGPGGRVPPTDVIDDDATGDVETSGTFDAAADGIDFWESLEDMRLDLGNAVAVGPTNSFGETPVLAQDGAGTTGRTPRGGILVTASDFNPERVVIDDLIVPAASMNVGDHYAGGSVVGVLDYNFGLFMLEATTPLSAVHDGVTPESTTPAGPDELAVATFNVENLDPGDPQAKFDRLAGIIVSNLRSPDLLALEEVQDNTGPTNNGVVDANLTLDKLAAAIVAAGGPAYAYRQVNPVDGADGGEPGGNIRVAFFFRTDRGLAFTDSPGGGSLTANSVLPSGDLQFSPGRIEPTSTAFNASRKPLAGQFTYQGRKLFAIVNHFNSKGGDDPLFGHNQPPTRSSETQRHQQATIVRNFSQAILAANPSGNVVVLGDLNDFHFSDTVSILEATPLHTLLETLPANEQYTYVFEGNSQSLDHILVSDAVFGRPFSYDVVHVNAEFADQASDHDPQLVRLVLNRAPTVSAGGPYTVAEGGSVGLAAAGSDPDGDALTYAWDLDDNGTFETSGQSPSFTWDDGPATRTVTVQATDPAGASATATATVTVTNVAPTATFTAPDSVPTGTFTITFTGQTDPSSADTTAGLEYAFDCGTGYDAFASAASANCSAPASGTRSVGGKIRDKDGGVSEYRDTVTVTGTTSPYDDVCALARAYSSKKSVANLVCAALAVAEAADAHGRPLVAHLSLAVAELTVQLESGKAFTKAEAKELRKRIQALY